MLGISEIQVPLSPEQALPQLPEIRKDFHLTPAIPPTQILVRSLNLSPEGICHRGQATTITLERQFVLTHRYRRYGLDREDGAEHHKPGWP